MPFQAGLFRLELPPQASLDEHTVAYHDVLGAGDEALNRWFGGKVVVVGDTRRDRPAPDWTAMGSKYRDGKVFNV